MKYLITIQIIIFSLSVNAQDNSDYIRMIKGSLNKCDFKYVRDNFRRMKGDTFNRDKVSYKVKNSNGQTKEVSGIPKVVLSWYIDELEQIMKNCKSKKTFDKKYSCLDELKQTYREKDQFRKKESTRVLDLPFAEGSVSLLKFCIEKLKNEYNRRSALKKKNDKKKKAQEIRDRKRKAEHKIKMKNGDFEFEKACELSHAVKILNKAIVNERRAGSVSGVVNKSALHEFGVKVVRLHDTISILKKDYKSKTSKKLDFNKCP